MNGLMVNVLRSAGYPDCTNGGTSITFDTGIITGDMIDCNVFESSDTCPEYVILEVAPTGTPFLKAIPKDLHESGKWVMFGGNFLYSSDSRFPSDAPIKIFDRCE